MKILIGNAPLVVRTLGPNYMVDNVIKCLACEYEGVASSDIVFKEFYQLKQEKNKKVFSIWLRDALANLSTQFPERVPQEDHERMLRDCFFYGIKPEMRNSIGNLYDSEKVTFGELLLKAKRNEYKEILVKVTSKSSVIESEAKGDLEEKVDKLLAVAKSGQMGNGKDKRDRSRTPETTPTNARQGTFTKRDSELDIRNSL